MRWSGALGVFEKALVVVLYGSWALLLTYITRLLIYITR